MEHSRADTAVPQHVAIIMDGNGRWAQARNLPRSIGHKAGARNVRKVVETCTAWGIEVLTLYAFSTENWNRPQVEVAFLMKLLQRYVERETPELKRQGVRLQILGRRAELPPKLLSLLDQAVRETSSGQRLTLNLAINYGGRAEIVDATRELAQAAQEGKLLPEQVNETLFSRFLYTAVVPDPDLVIRTGGELRLSNFLIWQTAGAYFWNTPTYWPDFGRADLLDAIRAWQEDRSNDTET